MGIAIDQTYERIQSLVLRLYPGAAATSDVRGVHRIRSFRFAQNGRENYVLTFIIDELSSITHRCLETLEPGDSLVVATTEANPIFQVILDAKQLDALKTSKPDRNNGSHHVEVAKLPQGFLVVRTANGGLPLPVVVVEPPRANQEDEFWGAVIDLIRVYPSRPERMTADFDAVRLRGVIDSGLRDFAQFLVPHNYWETTASVGKGRWADIPWCAVFDARETETAQKGVYPVMHFLTEPPAAVRIGLGVSVMEAGPSAATQKARDILPQLPAIRITDLQEHGFATITSPREDRNDEYGRGMVFSKVVPAAEIKRRASELTRDWRAVLEVYRDWANAKYGGKAHPERTVPPTEEPTPQSPTVDPFAELVDQTLWDEQELRDVLEALDRTHQIILAGPPGTSKTWVAECLSRFLVGGKPENELLLPFHPSYSYEDFIDGLRPVAQAGGIAFQPVPGKLVAFVRDRVYEAGPLVVIVDEMNRANLPRVFGELLYILEYRDRPIPLPYSGSFSLPRNLRLIGTMNTADRSIRSIDTALRRRFEVFECFPDAHILGSYYTTRRNDVAGLVEGFVRLNATLEEKLDRHHTIGHTFFMADPFTPSLLRSVWKRKISPLLEEYFLDSPDLGREITFGSLWPGISDAD